MSIDELLGVRYHAPRTLTGPVSLRTDEIVERATCSAWRALRSEHARTAW
jgi:hypothetical protein